nr:hypothetical protein [Tanacetum cinerariifolium]
MSSASSAVTYTSVYTDSESRRVFWGADEELSDGGSPRVIVYRYNGLPMLPDEHILSAKEQPLPPVVSPTAESLGYVAQSDPEEDPEEYKEDETKDGPVDYPMDGGDNGNDDDGNSSRYDADDEDEDEVEHLAPANSAIVIVIDELVSPPKGTQPTIPPPSTDTTTTGARISIRLQTSISLLPEAEVEILLAMPTSSPLPLTSLLLPLAGERLTRCMASATLPSPPLPPSLYPPPVDRRDGIPKSEQPPRKRLCLSTLVSRYKVGESYTRGRGVDYGFVDTIEAEIRHRGIREVGYGIKDTWIDLAEAVPEIAPTTLEKVNTRVKEFAELHKHDTQDLYALLEDACVDPLIDHHCCYECGNSLNDFFCHQCTCEFCVNGAQVGYNFPAQVPSFQTLPSFPQQYPCCEDCEVKERQEKDKIRSKPDKNGKRGEARKSQSQSQSRKKEKGEEIQVQRTNTGNSQKLYCFKNKYKGLYCNSLKNHHAFYDDDDDDDVDYTIAITPVLSIEEPDNSLSIGDEHLDTIPATESDEVIKSSVEDLDLVPIPSESKGIPDTMCDVHFVNNPTPLEAKDHYEIVINFKYDISSSDDDSLYNENIEYVEASPHDSEVVSLEVAENVIPKDKEIEDDNLREKLLNVHLLIANIEALKDNPALSSEFLTKSSSTSPKSFLEETNIFHNSLPEFENFYFNLEEISSGRTTTHSDISLLDYEAFYFDDDHIEEISSGSTTTHSDISLSEYDSFIFDFSDDQFPPTDRSDFAHEEFTDELAHIISPPEYDCFYFRNLPDSGECIPILKYGIRKNLYTTRVNLPVEDDHSPLLTYVVWIFLAYLTYPVIPPYLHSFGNEDTIFDPGIIIKLFCSFKPGLSHRCGTFKKFNTHCSHLNESPMEMLFSTCSPMDQ